MQSTPARQDSILSHSIVLYTHKRRPLIIYLLLFPLCLLHPTSNHVRRLLVGFVRIVVVVIASLFSTPHLYSSSSFVPFVPFVYPFLSSFSFRFIQSPVHLRIDRPAATTPKKNKTKRRRRKGLFFGRRRRRRRRNMFDKDGRVKGGTHVAERNLKRTSRGIGANDPSSYR